MFWASKLANQQEKIQGCSRGDGAEPSWKHICPFAEKEDEREGRRWRGRNSVSACERLSSVSSRRRVSTRLWSLPASTLGYIRGNVENGRSSGLIRMMLEALKGESGRREKDFYQRDGLGSNREIEIMALRVLRARRRSWEFHGVTVRASTGN